MVRLHEKKHLVFRTGDEIENGVGGVCRLLGTVKDRGYSAVETCLTGVADQGRVMHMTDNTRTQRDEMHNLDNVRLARVDAEKYYIEVLSKPFVWSELRCKNCLEEVVTCLFLEDFGAC